MVGVVVVLACIAYTYTLADVCTSIFGFPRNILIQTK